MTKRQIITTFLTFISVVGLFILGFGVFYLRKNIRQEEAVSEDSQYDTAFGELANPIERNYPTNIDLNFELDISDIPSSNNIYKVNRNDPYFPSEALTENVAAFYSMSETSSTERITNYYSVFQNANLEYDKSRDTIVLAFFDRKTKLKFTSTDTTPYIKSAREILKKLELWPYDDNYTAKTNYYIVDVYNYYKTSKVKKANLIKVIFTTTIDEMPFLSSSSNSGEIEVLLNKEKELIKVTYSYRPIQKDEIATYPVITVNDASDKIKLGQVEMVIPFEGFTPSTLRIRSAVFAYKIEYEKQDILQLVYVFEGRDNNQQDISLIVPAVTDTYLSE